MFKATTKIGSTPVNTGGSTGGSTASLSELGGVPITLIGAANGLPQLDANRKILKQYVDASVSSININTRTPITAHRMIMADGEGYATYVNNDTLDHANRCLGMSTVAVLAGTPVSLQRSGELTDPSFNFTPGPLWIGNNGYLTSTPPDEADAVFSQQVANAITPTRIDLHINAAFLLK